MNALLRRERKLGWFRSEWEYVPVEVIGYSPRHKTVRMISTVQGAWEITRDVLVKFKDGSTIEVDEQKLFYSEPQDNPQ